MGTRLARIVLGAVVLLALLGSPAGALTYFFTGQCTDCFGGAGMATATLVLQNYTPGDPIQSSHLVSFTYDGTDLLGPYVVTPDTLAGISGAMPESPPAFASFAIWIDEPGFFRLFGTGLNGDWSIDDDGFDDFGTQGIWSVPEPATLLLSLAGLAALGVVRPQRRWRPLRAVVKR